MGEPAGIGPELALRAWLAREQACLAPFFVLADPDLLKTTARALGLAAPTRRIETPREAVDLFADALPVLPIPLPSPVAPGRPDVANASAVIASIETATSLALDGQASAIVTNPIHKSVLYQGGFSFSGHTDFVASLCERKLGPDGSCKPVMMLACPGLRVVPVTVHIALSQVVGTLTRDLVIDCGRITAQALARDFGIADPRLAVAGLNPHAGEGGAMGREEIEIIEPAIDILRSEGISVAGPIPADSLFHAAKRESYDAVLCMYHDQALIPVKTIDFSNLVNVTLGLPVVRTSPGHGTALNIAGGGVADATSLIAAIEAAGNFAAQRAS